MISTYLPLRWPLAALIVATFLAGCATAPAPQKSNSQPVDVFYPAAPQAPRIQHLATFTGEANFAAKQSSFETFIAGEEKGAALATIYGIGIDQGRLYAVDSKSSGVAVFDLNRQQFSSFTGAGGGKMRLPINITIDQDGTKYITDTGRNQVLRYDRENRFLSAFGEQGQFRPVDTAIVGDKLYVVDILHQEVQVLHKLTGKLLFKFGSPGLKAGEMLHPTNIAVGPSGDIFVVETSNFRVQRFSPDGKPVSMFGEVGDTPGKFARPKGIAIDREGRIYVADAAFQNVQLFTNDGKLLMDFGQPGKGEGMSLPAAVKIDYDSVPLFKKYADPKFTIEYIIFVSSQVAPNKIDVFGFGKMAGADYSNAKPAGKP